MLWLIIPCVCHYSSICRSLGLCWLTPVCHVLPLVLLVSSEKCHVSSRLKAADESSHLSATCGFVPVPQGSCPTSLNRTFPSLKLVVLLMMYVFFSWHWWVFIPLCSWVFRLILADLSWSTACESSRYKLNMLKQIVLVIITHICVSELWFKFVRINAVFEHLSHPNMPKHEAINALLHAGIQLCHCQPGAVATAN